MAGAGRKGRQVEFPPSWPGSLPLLYVYLDRHTLRMAQTDTPSLHAPSAHEPFPVPRKQFQHLGTGAWLQGRKGDMMMRAGRGTRKVGEVKAVARLNSVTLIASGPCHLSLCIIFYIMTPEDSKPFILQLLL